MFRQAGVICCAVVLLLPATLSAQTYLTGTREEYLASIQAALLDEQFARVDSICMEMADVFPDDPAPLVFRAASMLGEMTSREENIYGDTFRDLLDTTEVLCSGLLEKARGERAAWLNLYLGNVYAYRALWEARFGSNLTAVKQGYKSRDAYKAGLEADSSVYDTYVGLGSFHYWKSARAGLLRWVGIISDERERGLDEIRLAIDSARVFNDLARNALIWMLMNEKRYDSALAMARALYGKYPEGELFLWPMAQAQFELKRYRHAVALYQTIRARIENNPGNYFNIIQCDYFVCRAFVKLDDHTQAQLVAREAREYLDEVPGDVARRLDNKITYLKRLSRL